MNNVSLIGRITQDLELRTTGTGKDVVGYTLAVNIDKATTEFINCTTFGDMAKYMNQYCKKGDQIAVNGQLRTSQYTDKENKKHTNTYVLTNRVMFLNNKKETKVETQVNAPSVEKTKVEIPDSELPF